MKKVQSVTKRPRGKKLLIPLSMDIDKDFIEADGFELGLEGWI